MRFRHGGFTLVEMLVAVATGVLLLGGLTQVLVNVGEGWERSLKAERVLAERRVLLEVIGRTLNAGVAAGAAGNEGGLWGDGSGLEILVSPPQSGYALGRLRAKLTGEVQADGSHSLVLSLDNAGSPSVGGGLLESLPPKRKWVLAAGLKGVQFRYLGGEDQEPKDSWRDRGVAPELVEVRGEYLDASRPPLWVAVRPRIVMPGDCNFDWTSLKCRAS